jgi:membrane-associated protein
MALDPTHIIESVGALGVFAIVFSETGLFFGFFLPGDSLLIPIGILAAQGYLDPWSFGAVIALAAICGDSFGYFLGKKYGSAVFKKEDSFFFDKKYIDKTERFYKKHGSATIFLARFTPIVRTFAPAMAGVGKMPYRTFLFWNILGALVWPATLISLGYFFGSKIPNVDKYIIPSVIIIVVIFALPVVFHWLKRVFQKRSLSK